MRRKTRSLISLKHAVAESVLFRYLEVGIQEPGRIVDIFELGISGRTTCAPVTQDTGILLAPFIFPLAYMATNAECS